MILAILFAGCGGGEDFSKPPAQIQSQLANATTNADASTDSTPVSADAAAPTDPADANADNPEQAGSGSPATEDVAAVGSESTSEMKAGAVKDVAAVATPAAAAAAAATSDAAAVVPDKGMPKAEAAAILLQQHQVRQQLRPVTAQKS